MRVDGRYSNKELSEAAILMSIPKVHDSSATPAISRVSKHNVLEAQLRKSQTHTNGGSADFPAPDSENADRAAYRQAWLPEEAHPGSPRLDGGAASPAPPSLDEALRPLLPDSGERVFSSLAKANSLVSTQLQLLAGTAKEVRAQYERVRWRELEKLRAQRLPHAVFNKPAKEVQQLGERWKHVDLAASHELTKGTRLDTCLSGSPLRFDQVSLKLLHVGSNGSAVSGPATRRQLSVTGATDLRSRSRLALEGTLSTEDDSHSCSTILASDNLSYLSWGIASQHRLGKSLTLFARASGDDFQGKKIILQTVHTLNLRDSVSPVVAIALGRALQAGVGWTRQLSHDPSRLDNKITLKLLASRKGAYALNFAYQGTDL